jgi:hypothetical protein
MTNSIWPLFDLVVSTPRLSLRYVTDDLGGQLAELAARGIHEPDTMPFSEPWTDAAPPELQRNALRYYWRSRAETTSEHWQLNLAAHDREGRLFGMCSVDAEGFPTPARRPPGLGSADSVNGKGLVESYVTLLCT